MIPIAQLLRKKLKKKKPKTDEKVKISSIDAIISSLETDLANSEGEGDDDVVLEEVDEEGNLVRLVSSNLDDKIEPLPAHLLPLPMPKSKGKKTPREEKVESRKRAVRFPDEVTVEKNEVKRPRSEAPAIVPSPGGGLEATIREMMKHYIPASADKKPFWCRVCRKQEDNVEDFELHKRSEEHKIAASIERKMSFCRLCKKQFTSPDQLQGHLKGNPHKQALEAAKSQQDNARKFR